MLSLMHKLRFDKTKKDHNHSFSKSLGNYNTSELIETHDINNQLLSSNWITIYRKQ